MGSFGSRIIQLFNGCYTIDGVHARIYSVEQRMQAIERAQTTLDRKYSDMTIVEELSRQQFRTLQYEMTQVIHRMDVMEQNDEMEEIVVLRS